MTSNIYDGSSVRSFDRGNAAALGALIQFCYDQFVKLRQQQTGHVESDRWATKGKRAHARSANNPPPLSQHAKAWRAIAEFALEHQLDPAELVNELYTRAPRFTKHVQPYHMASANLMQDVLQVLGKREDDPADCHRYVERYAYACTMAANVLRASGEAGFRKFLLLPQNGLDPLMCCVFGSKFPEVVRHWRPEVNELLKIHPRYTRCLLKMGVDLNFLTPEPDNARKAQD